MAGKGTGGGGPTTRGLGAHVLIVEARYYEDIADEMATGAIAVLEKHGCTYERIAVPGALEIPQVLAAANCTPTSMTSWANLSIRSTAPLRLDASFAARPTTSRSSATRRTDT